MIALDQLETFATWKEDLQERIRRTRLRFELDGVSPEEIIALSAETESFKRACRTARGEWGPA